VVVAVIVVNVVIVIEAVEFYNYNEPIYIHIVYPYMSARLIAQIIPADANLQSAFATASDDEQKLIQNLGLFLSGYLRVHGALLENSVCVCVCVRACVCVIISMYFFPRNCVSKTGYNHDFLCFRAIFFLNR
jgi:hypothetical protein